MRKFENSMRAAVRHRGSEFARAVMPFECRGFSKGVYVTGKAGVFEGNLFVYCAETVEESSTKGHIRYISSHTHIHISTSC